ncbi:MAG TPA: GAF and ANTAR domain-containing protein, partial [Actinomycetota bacterium]|nr:GAF and ANTAR domain-containing protein [Actinomycetota bacterium]
DIAVGLAHEVLPGTVGAGVTLIREGKKLSAAYSDDVVQKADALQYQLDEGPCLSAWAESSSFRIDDMRTETRWPRWTRAAAELGMRSTVSVPLFGGGLPLGAVKAYSMELAAYDETSEAVLSKFAVQAGIVLGNVLAAEEAERLSDSLKEALGSRQVIALAMGVLMERYAVGEAEAFTLLRKAAAEKGLGVRAMSEHIVKNGRRSQSRSDRLEG